MEQTNVIYVGIDWASEAHEICVLDSAGTKIDGFSVEHSGEGMEDLGRRLRSLASGDFATIKVAIEVPRGVVVETLLALGCKVFSVNPKQLDRFRDRHTVAGAKDDSRDAYVLADSLRTDEHLFREARLSPEIIVRLREILSIRKDLGKQERRLANQLRAQLLRYYPQVLTLSPGADEPWLLDLLEKAPTPKQGAALRRNQIDKILRTHRIRRLSADDVVSALRKRPLKPVPGVIEASSEHVQYLIERLRLVQTQKRRIEKSRDQILSELTYEENPGEHRDATILLSLPGAGNQIVTTMLAWATEAILDRAYYNLRLNCGAAPVTKSSGKRRFVQRRQAYNRELQEALYHWARGAIRSDEYFNSIYRRARARGKRHGTALRIVGDKLLQVACAALRDGRLYDPSLLSKREAA